ncbi:MAG: hypothetical protein ACLQBD_25725 [Syntrophobacteraceae bacterium]
MEILKDVASIVASFAALGVIGVAVSAYKTYKINSSIKRLEFIDEVYKIFDDDTDITNLHSLLIEDEDLSIPLKSVKDPDDDNELALIKALTLFDRICNYYEQKIINKESLSYIAAEVLDFYTHKGVIDYIKESHKYYGYDKIGYKYDIRFYSGLGELGKICTEQFISDAARSFKTRTGQ